jgi:GAF domain-containing protein
MEQRNDKFFSILSRVKSSPYSGARLRRFAMELLKELPHYDWCGIYRLEGDHLVLDEFVGDPTEHTVIPVGRGVCGTAVAENRNQIIPDVRNVENYLSCDVRTRSEIVVLIRSGNKILGQIDVDSHTVQAFSETDERGLEELSQILAERWSPRQVIKKIVSGGQTGVDRAALDVALMLGIPHGGWCPEGRLAEDGVIPPQYQLKETPSPLAEVRTEWNVRDSDGTLVLTKGEPSGGTAYTIEQAMKYGKPLFVGDLSQTPEEELIQQIGDWLSSHPLSTLNVAGPRESKAPGIYEATKRLLLSVLGRE